MIIFHISKTEHKFYVVYFPIRVVSDCEKNFGIVVIIEVVSEIKVVFSCSISHHVWLDDFSVKGFRLYRNILGEIDFLNDLIPSTP